MMIVEVSQDTSPQWSKPNESLIFGILKIEKPGVKDSKPGHDTGVRSEYRSVSVSVPCHMLLTLPIARWLHNYCRRGEPWCRVRVLL